MEDYEFDVARADLLEQSSRFSEAAEIRFQEGDVVKAISLLLQDGTTESRSRALVCLLEGLWKHLPFGVTMRFLQDRGDSVKFVDSLLELGKQFLKAPEVPEHTKDTVRSELRFCVMHG